MLHLTEAEALENSEDSESKPLELLEERRLSDTSEN